MKRSKRFWLLLWLLFTLGGFFIGYVVGQKRIFNHLPNITLFTDSPEFIDPSFQIFFYEKYKVKLLVEKRGSESNIQNIYFTELARTPANQIASGFSFDSKKISPQFSHLIKSYPQFIPLFWRVIGDKAPYELKVYGLWIPEEVRNQSLRLLISDENLQAWVDSTKEKTTLNADYFNFDISRSSTRIRDYPFTELKLIRPATDQQK